MRTLLSPSLSSLGLSDVLTLARPLRRLQGHALVLAAAWMAGLGALGGIGAPARADPLNPLDFPSLGTVTLPAGVYTINTAGAPTLTGPDTNIIGTVSAAGIAVFAFENLTLLSGVTINVVGDTGSRPVALLARGDLVFAGLLNANGANGGAAGLYNGVGGFGGPGGSIGGGGGSLAECDGSFVGGAGSDGGGTGGGRGGAGTEGGGGSFGGAGLNLSPFPGLGQVCGVQPNIQLSGGSGGGGGCGGGVFPRGSGAGGGGGGGAVELGAIGALSLGSGSISANGGDGGVSPINLFGGGGSGGAVLLHGGTITLGASVLANGGGSIGGGGGGRIAVQATADPGTFGLQVWPGPSPMGQPGDGVITFARPVLSPTNLDCGSVPVGSTITVHMIIQNTGDAGSFINGQFPAASAPFARVGAGIFSGLKQGTSTPCPYSFTPTTPGAFTQQLTFLSNAGPVSVTISGTGIDPASDCPADFDNSGTLAVPDIFSFLSAWFAGCP